MLNLYSQCLKKGSSHVTLSSLLDPDLTSDYHSPTDQRDLFPSANTLNISQSDSGNLEWQWANYWDTDANPLQYVLLRLSPLSEQPNIPILPFNSDLFVMIAPLHVKSPTSALFPGVNVFTELVRQWPPGGSSWRGASAKAAHHTRLSTHWMRKVLDYWSSLTHSHHAVDLYPLHTLIIDRLSKVFQISWGIFSFLFIIQFIFSWALQLTESHLLRTLEHPTSDIRVTTQFFMLWWM